MGEFVTITEAAKFLSVHPSTVWRLIRDGRLSEHWMEGPQRMGADLDETDAKLRPI